MKVSFLLFMPQTCLFSLLLFCYLMALSNSVSYSMGPRCHVDESLALLQFKESFIISNNCSTPKLSSWKLHGQRSDCCSWDGVECDNETNHVISLNLSSSCLFGSINSTSTLFHLVHLTSLNLANNDFNFSHLPPELGHLSMLTDLSLSSSGFSGQIPPQISNLSNLVTLDISWCNFTGLLPSSLGNLTNLEALDLSKNHFGGPSDSFSWLGKLTKLNFLNLYGLNLIGNIPSSFANLTQLSYIDLGYSNVTGPIPHWLMNMTELSYIFLDHNQLVGQIPTWLIYGNNIEILFLASNQLSGSIPSVNNTSSQIFHLDLSSNKLQGTIPSSVYKLKSLLLLELHFNSLVGVVNMSMFFQLNSLVVLSLSFNNLRLLANFSSSTKVQNFSFLGLSSCNLNEFPSFLHNQDELQFLDLSSNNIHGQIPSWVWKISPNSLEIMNLSYNSLSGFEQSPYPFALQWAHLRILDLRYNLLQGSLSIPASFQKQLRNGCKLRVINLSQNQLQGKVPRSLANCVELELVDLSNNKFTDTFPSWLGALRGLRILVLRSNGFHGVMKEDEVSVPFSKLQIIDLSLNHFKGRLPSFYFENWKSMKVLGDTHIRYMGKNQEFTTSAYYNNYDYAITMNTKGLELEYPKLPSSLVAIDFSHNRFEGEVPNSIGNLKGLRFLNLSSNILTGEIPSSLVNLKELESLDLAMNKFMGEIPPQLAELTFLSYFNVAYNQLEGPIPSGNQFDTFEEKAYEGNLNLCGVPLKKRCGNVEESPPPISKDEDLGSPFEFGWKIVLIGYGIGFAIGAVIGHIITRKKQAWFVTTFRIKQPKRRHRQTRNRNRN